MSEESICFVGGGTGGHILPALTLARRWYRENRGDVVFITSVIALDRQLDKKILDSCSFISRYFRNNLIKPPGKKLWLYPKFITQFTLIFIKTIYIFMYYHPDRVVSTGGYISVPVCLAAKFVGVKRLDLYDVNAQPGKATTFLARFADNIYITFKNCAKYFKKSKLVKYPIRFTAADKKYDRDTVLEFLGLSISRITIFLIGGSQGALFLNNILRRWLEYNHDLHDRIQIIHQTGNFDQYSWKSFYQKIGVPYILFKYSDDVKFYYQAADVVISRAGAGTVSELGFFEKHSLIIPHKVAYTSHQKYNAEDLVQEYPDRMFVLEQDVIEDNFEVFNSHLRDFIVQNHSQ